MIVQLGNTTVRVRLKHFLHPIRSTKSLYRIVSHQVVRYFAERQLQAKIQRGHRDCCWCGGALLPFKWHQSYGVCANCGCYVNRYPPLNLQELYSLDLYWHKVQRFHDYPTIEQRAQSYKADGRVDYWLQVIRRYGPEKGVVVEIGCAPGICLAELNARGYQCIGVEPDESTAQWIRENMGVEVRSGFFPGVDLPPCDLFLAFDVLEHSPQPDEFMREAARLLNSRGVAIVQTPVERYGYEPPFGEAFHSAFKDIEHLFLFTNKTMQRFADYAGLEVIDMHEQLALHHEICVFRKP